jgi:hypothetical protein
MMSTQPGNALPAVPAALSVERMSTYLYACNGSQADAVALYVWNLRASGAFWETLDVVEVVLRNALDQRLATRHTRLRRVGSWLAIAAANSIPTPTPISLSLAGGSGANTRCIAACPTC